uniref:Uncharacterized protein n=2 Tax=Micrurus surinamensis TaxID=129470 RepID=A0A2D4PML8_MICSU
MRGVEICIPSTVSRKPHSPRGRYIERRRHKSNREVEPERLLHLLPREAGGGRGFKGKPQTSEHEIPGRVCPRANAEKGREKQSRRRDATGVTESPSAVPVDTFLFRDTSHSR